MRLENINRDVFKELWDIKPEKNGELLIRDKLTGEYNKELRYRSYMGYGVNPKFEKTNNSYMFLEYSKDMPNIIRILLQIAGDYNQVTVNWYNPDDYIEEHSDCTAQWLDRNSSILMFNFNEDDTTESIRDLVFRDKQTNEEFVLPLINKGVFEITNNTTHTHRVGKGNKKRVSVTFRNIKE